LTRVHRQLRLEVGGVLPLVQIVGVRLLQLELVGFRSAGVDLGPGLRVQGGRIGRPVLERGRDIGDHVPVVVRLERAIGGNGGHRQRHEQRRDPVEQRAPRDGSHHRLADTRLHCPAEQGSLLRRHVLSPPAIAR
jgi:hypothetical protein